MPEIDRPTYPSLGNIYPGDYYPDIPYDEYIRRDQPLPEGKQVFDIRDYGAVPDDGLVYTREISLAVQACEQAGGGVLLVTGGSYITGIVRVPSHTTLFITPDAELRASRDAEQMIVKADGVNERGTEAQMGALILLKGAEDVTITGGGRISGSGEWFVYEPRELPTYEPTAVAAVPRRDQKHIINTVPGTMRYVVRQRIRYAQDKYNEGKPNLRRPAGMVWVQECRDVRIENIILHDAMSWTLHIDGCDRVHVRDMVIDDNRHVANADGVDVDGSADVLVEHCFISCSDDALCVKNPAHTNRSTERITFRDCVAMTVANCFKIGTETRWDISDVLVENCRFIMPDIWPGAVGGISIESCDGSNISHVTVRNITMDKACCPIYVVLERRNRYKAPYTADPDAGSWWGGSIRDVLIEHVTADRAESPCILTGYTDMREDGVLIRRAPEHITIRDFTMNYHNNGEHIQLPETVPEFLEDYPESNAHGDVPACGIWARHVDDLRLEDIRINPRACNTREKIIICD